MIGNEPRRVLSIAFILSVGTLLIRGEYDWFGYIVLSVAILLLSWMPKGHHADKPKNREE